ncbi:MAG: trigger factor [Saprospiraceae bacterium]|nr:trigger factor [Saprospiraceae bacterium]
MPHISRQDIDATTAVITVSVPKEELQPALERELKKFKNRASIKGFRKGHAPMPHIKRLFGSSIFNEVLNDMISKELFDYLQNSGLEVLGQPLPSAGQPPFSFSIDRLEPEYNLQFDIGHVPPFDIQGLSPSETYEVLTISNLDELAEQDLKHIRERAGNQNETDEVIADNDLVRVAAREWEGDAPKPDGWETSILFNVNNIVDEATKALVKTLKKGDSLRFSARKIDKFGQEDETRYRKYILNLPEDDLRAVGDEFEGTIESVLRATQPELNEDFFKTQFGEHVADKETAMEEIKKAVAQFYQTRAFALLVRDMQKRLLELNRIELPESFLARWLTETNRDTLTPGQVEQELPSFLNGLRWNLLRDKLMARFGIEVTDEEVKAVYTERIRGYFNGQADEDLVSSLAERFMGTDEKRDEVVKEVEANKLYAALRESVTLVDKPVTSEAFHQLFEELR